MAGLTKDTPLPTAITLHQKSRVLEIAFADGRSFQLPYEYLRVYSPSAEVRGHGAGQEKLQANKREVGVERVEPVGNYALKPVFTDGHDSGLYSWDYLYELGVNYDAWWADYLAKLETAGLSREPLPPAALNEGACGSGSCGCKS